MFARLRTGNARIAFAALVISTLLGGCATSGQPQTATSAPQAGSSEQFSRLGDRARNRGDLALAASFYRQAYDAQPANVGPLVSLGHVLLEMGAPAKAEEAFQAALMREPRNFEALRGLGNARIEQHNPQKAIPPLEQAMAVAANDFRVLNALGVAHDMTGNHVEAQKHYQSGLAIAPDNTGLLSNYSLSLALSGRHEEAIQILKPIAEAPGATLQQRQTYALVHGLAGDSTEAERIARLDLDEGAVQTNLKRYAAIRETGLTKASAGAPAAETVSDSAVETAPLEEQSPTKVPAQPAALASTGPAVSAPETASAKPTAEAGPARAKAVPLVAPVEAEPIAAEPTATRSQTDEALATATSTLSSSGANGQQASAALVDEDTELSGGTAGAANPAHDWLVQLASYENQTDAEDGWRELSAMAPELLVPLKPLVQEANLGEELGRVYRLRTGPFSFAEARSLCNRLHEKQIDCVLADF